MANAPRILGPHVPLAAGEVLLGSAVAWEIGGPRAALGLALGGTAATVGSVLGRLPFCWVGPEPGALVNGAIAGMGIRLLSTLVLASVLLFAVPIPREPVAIGLVLIYLSVLALEVRELAALGRRATDPPPSRREHPDGAPTR